MTVSINAVDLFCGAGGLTRGLLDAGVSVRAGIDFNKKCEFAYTFNNKQTKFVHKSVADLTGVMLSSLFGDNGVKLLCGCAPCQTFSSMNQRDEERRRKDRRWTLLLEFRRLVQECVPELVTMENVPGLLNTDVFEQFVDALKQLDYWVDYKILDCSEYGMPQKRHRLVLVASRLGGISIPSSNELNIEKTTVKDAIGNLPKLSAGEIDSDDSLHCASRLTEINLKRIKASVPGGTWNDWGDELRLPCHKKKEGEGYDAVYGRMEWDKPSPTITTQFYNYGSGRFGHPEQDRALSLREGALLQGFSKTYAFFDSSHPVDRRALGVMIGNAVPVGLARIIGETFINHVEQVEHKKAGFVRCC